MNNKKTFYFSFFSCFISLQHQKCIIASQIIATLLFVQKFVQLRINGPFRWEQHVIYVFPSQKNSNAESVNMLWRHGKMFFTIPDLHPTPVLNQQLPPSLSDMRNLFETYVLYMYITSNIYQSAPRRISDCDLYPK